MISHLCRVFALFAEKICLVCKLQKSVSFVSRFQTSFVSVLIELSSISSSSSLRCLKSDFHVIFFDFSSQCTNLYSALLIF